MRCIEQLKQFDSGFLYPCFIQSTKCVRLGFINLGECSQGPGCVKISLLIYIACFCFYVAFTSILFIYAVVHVC